MEERIIEKAEQLFFRFGVRGVSMDDIAHELGVSKKTIYQYYPDKNTLIDMLITGMLNNHTRYLNENLGSAKNAIEEVLIEMNATYQILTRINQVFFFELQKYFPLIWEKIEHYKCVNSKKRITDNLERGIQEGLYRANPDMETLAAIRIQQVESIFQKDMFHDQKFHPYKILLTQTSLYLFGISTPKGYAVTEEQLEVYHQTLLK